MPGLQLLPDAFYRKPVIFRRSYRNCTSVYAPVYAPHAHFCVIADTLDPLT